MSYFGGCSWRRVRRIRYVPGALTGHVGAACGCRVNFCNHLFTGIPYPGGKERNYFTLEIIQRIALVSASRLIAATLKGDSELAGISVARIDTTAIFHEWLAWNYGNSRSRLTVGCSPAAVRNKLNVLRTDVLG